MKRLTIVCVSRRRETPQYALKKMDEIFGKYIPKKYSSYYTRETYYPFEEDSPHIQELLDFAKEHVLDCEFVSGIYFTQSEIDKMPFFELRLPDPLELEGKWPSDYGTVYEGRCDNCHFGGTLIGDLLIDRKFMKRAKVVSSNEHYFLNKDIKTIFEDNGLTGISYVGEVKDYKGREMLPFELFTCEHILPPVSPTTAIKDNGYICKQCGFKKLYLQCPLEYEKEKFAGALDFNFSYEYLNNDQARLLIVSAKVKKIFKEHGIPGTFLPILLLD